LILGVGLEIMEIEPFREELARRGDSRIEQVLSTAEIEYCRTKHSPFAYYAVRIAAKEAFRKAMGGAGQETIPWLDMEVRHDPGGRPSLLLHGEAARLAGERGVRRTHLSLTHSRSHAAAAVLLEVRA
jgi:holo-[acyl-carrier protein] synthase